MEKRILKLEKDKEYYYLEYENENGNIKSVLFNNLEDLSDFLTKIKNKRKGSLTTKKKNAIRAI